jgi:hypothetical protein
MKKVELIKQLEAAKALSSQVDIDKVIVLIEQIESEAKIGITQALADEVAGRIERALDHNNHDFIDLDSAELDLTYDNRIEVTNVDVDIRGIMDHVEAVLEEYVIEEPEEEETVVSEPTSPEQDEE